MTPKSEYSFKRIVMITVAIGVVFGVVIWFAGILLTNQTPKQSTSSLTKSMTVKPTSALAPATATDVPATSTSTATYAPATAEYRAIVVGTLASIKATAEYEATATGDITQLLVLTPRPKLTNDTEYAYINGMGEDGLSLGPINLWNESGKVACSLRHNDKVIVIRYGRSLRQYAGGQRDEGYMIQSVDNPSCKGVVSPWAIGR